MCDLAIYAAFQKYFRQRQPPMLAVWGKHDSTFVAAGAEACHKGLPLAEIHLLDTGHFALETHAAEIGALMREFLVRAIENVGKPRHASPA